MLNPLSRFIRPRTLMTPEPRLALHGLFSRPRHGKLLLFLRNPLEHESRHVTSHVFISSRAARFLEYYDASVQEFLRP